MIKETEQVVKTFQLKTKQKSTSFRRFSQEILKNILGTDHSNLIQTIL